MKELIRQHALALGFDDCAFTSAAPPANAEFFQRWLGEGNHGEMAWLQRNADKRMDPERVLAEAKTVIVIVASYGLDRQWPQAASQMLDESNLTLGEGLRSTQTDQKSNFVLSNAMVTKGGKSLAPVPCPADLVPPLHGLVARYARFKDYHQILGKKLQALVAWLHENSAKRIHSLWYVDTGPLLEKDLAQRAGMGFIGKHTNLIHRQLGNWFFLGEIITTLELETDTPEKNRCGSCTRCLTACPTQAITAPFHLDARRCISYLTIELKGSIPVELRPAVGRRIFGCDDCLAVCPWNRFARSGNLMRPHAREDLAELNLVKLLELDEAMFKRLFGGTPVERLKRRGLLRNVCVALGNSGQMEAVPALIRATREEDPLIAEHAQWALEKITRSSC